MMRMMLYEAAQIMLVRSTKWSWLRANCTGNLRSTERWNDVPRGTMDEVSSYVRLNLPLPRRQGRAKDCSTSSSNPMMESEEKREPVSGIDTGVLDSLNVLDPRRPIREADIC